MSQRRLHITLLLMVLAILTVAGFQAYWLLKNYKEEKQLLAIRTNVLFREAVNQCQMEKLVKDSSIDIRVDNSVGMITALRRRIDLDTAHLIEPKGTMIINVTKARLSDQKDRTDSIVIGDSAERTIRYFNKTGKAGWVQVLQGVDSLQDTLTIKEIQHRYGDLLKKEKISLPFSIQRRTGTLKEEFPVKDVGTTNEVTVGFFHPITFSMSLQQTGSYLFRKLLQPILVSVFLVGITLFTFLLLYRNLLQQRRLTEQKNEFVSNITHELKTPIATVGVAIEALKNFNAINDPVRTREYLDISSSEIQRLGLLVDKVLKLSLFENKAITLQKEKIDLLLLTQEVMASMRLQFEKMKANVQLHTAGDRFVMEGDKLHISSVVYNLLDNALKYSSGEPMIDITLTSHPEHISLQVSDKGMGIPEEYRNKIFEKFFRIPGGDRHNIKGYGLGLSYVNHIVRQHQGFIEVKSELGKGSLFTVNLPYQTENRIQQKTA